jgi:hypothetical protein
MGLHTFSRDAKAGWRCNARVRWRGVGVAMRRQIGAKAEWRCGARTRWRCEYSASARGAETGGIHVWAGQHPRLTILIAFKHI